MRFEVYGETLNVSGLRELGAANAKTFRDQCSLALGQGQRFVHVDLSETVFVDSSGLGALLFLHKAAARRQGLVRLLYPKPAVQQILELTRLYRILEIVPVGQAVPVLDSADP